MDKAFFETIKDSKIALVSVLEDLPLMKNVILFSKYEAGSEEGVMAILTKILLAKTDLPKEIKGYFESLDEGYISAETNIGEDEIEELCAKIKNASNPLIVFGKDLFLNPRSDNISKFINIIDNFTNIELKCLGELNSKELHVEEIQEIRSFDGAVVFEYNSSANKALLVGSAQFGITAKIKDKDLVSVLNQDREFRLDKRLKGNYCYDGN